MSQYVKYLVCYDVANSRIRSKLFENLKDLGLVPIQKSVFYGDLKPPEVRALVKIVNDLLDENTDSCFWFPCRLNIDELRGCIGLKKFVYDEPDGHRVL